MNFQQLIGAITACGALYSCSKSTGPLESGTASTSLGVESSSSVAAASASVTPRQPEPRAWRGEPCGALECRRYENAASALTDILQLQPEVIAFGEAHALLGTEQIVPTSTRFQAQLLPLLANAGARDLVVELLKPAVGCDASIASTRKVQAPVTKQHAPENQNRFVELGHAARRAGVVPHLLEPDCEEYGSIAKAGEDGVIRMLELIALKTEQSLLGLREKRRGSGTHALTLAYGGAVHNDVLNGSEGGGFRAGFSFGRTLTEATAGRYLAVDLIVPEFIKETPTWQALPWVQHYRSLGVADKVTLFRTGAESFVIVFAPGPKPKPE